MFTAKMFGLIFFFSVVFIELTIGGMPAPDKNMAPGAKVRLRDMVSCETTSKDAVQVDFYLKNTETEGYKSLTGSLVTDITIDNNLYLTVQIDKYNNGDWNNNLVSKEGQLCDIIEEYVPDAWKKVSESFQPSLSSECVIPPGKYELKDFELLLSDIKEVPTLLGRFRATTNIYQGDETVLCSVSEIMISET